jgi:hypothetical protein
MTMARIALGILGIVLAGVGGCAAPARVVQQDSQKIVIAVADDSDSFPNYYGSEATKLAGQYMTDPVRVASSRVKVGETMTNNLNSNRTDLGGDKTPKFGEAVSSTNTTTVEDKYEYHIVFQSRSPLQRDPKTGNLVPTPNGSTSIAPNGVQNANWNTRGVSKNSPEMRSSIPPVSTPTPGPSTGLNGSSGASGPAGGAGFGPGR